MPITRTPIIDDSGSGKDGTVIDNAWKQQFYDQIDALIGGQVQPTYGTFTFTDGSGAGLTFTSATGAYAKVGRIVTITAQVIYPSTANGLPAKLAGLPFVASGNASLYQGYGAVAVRTWASGTTVVEIFGAASGGSMTNQLMSGVNMTLHGTYLTT